MSPRIPRARSSLLFWLIGVFAAVAIGGMIAMWSVIFYVAFRVDHANKVEREERKANPLPTREEFEAKVRECRTKQDVLERFGRPESTSKGFGLESWTYHKMSRDAISGKPDLGVFIHFDREGNLAKKDPVNFF